MLRSQARGNQWWNPQGSGNPAIDSMIGAIPGVQRLTQAIGEASPPDFGTFIEPGLRRAIEFNLNEGGMPQQEYDASRRRLGAGLNTALSRANVGNARRGSWNPSSVGSSTRPEFGQFGDALAGLEGQRAQLRQTAVNQAGQHLTSLAPIAAQQSRAAQEGFGEFLRQYGSGPGFSILSSSRQRALP